MKKWYDISAKGHELTILLYDSIGSWGISAKDFIEDLNAQKDITSIILRINSPGGDVFDGAAIYNSLRRHNATVTTYIDGLAASMATVIAMAGETINISETAMMMIHNPSGGSYGEAKDMIKYADLLEKIKETMISAYQTKTKLSNEELTVIMDDETWLNAEEAVSFGFANEVVDQLDMAASLKTFDLSMFKKAPKQDKCEKVKVKFTEITKEISQTVAEAINNTSVNTDSTKEVIMTDKVKASTVNVDEIKELSIQEGIKAGIKLETERRSGITMAFKGFDDHKEVLATCLENPEMTIDASRILLLEAIGKTNESLAGDESIEVGMNSHDKFKKAGVEAMEMRAGYIPTKRDNDLYGRTLAEVARTSLELKGTNISGMNKREYIGIAMTTTSDFPFILSNSANKAMQMGYEEEPESYSSWTRKGNLSDFKVSDRNTKSAFTNLDEVKENGEFKHGTFTEGREQIQLLTFGKLFTLSRQMIINDDLNAFTTVPNDMGRAARRKVGDLVYGILNSNPIMADGFALFSTEHKNLAGAPGIIDTASLDTARTAMKTQKDPSGNATLNIRPNYLVVPVAIEGVASDVLNSKFRVDGTQNDQNKPNNVMSLAELISEARLDNVSSTAWFLAASPMAFSTIEVAFLDGIDAPFLETQGGWTVDGIDHKVRIDAAAKALDHRGLYMNAG